MQLRKRERSDDPGPSGGADRGGLRLGQRAVAQEAGQVDRRMASIPVSVAAGSAFRAAPNQASRPGVPRLRVGGRRSRNLTFTGATISNLMLNAVAGVIMVAMLLLQQGGGMNAQQAGFIPSVTPSSSSPSSG